MKLLALCGAAGAGKDTVADALPARKLAFADTLYREVAEAFGVTVAELKCREGKENQSGSLGLIFCAVPDFAKFLGKEWDLEYMYRPRSPRQILHWWGDYRRAQDPDYFVNAVRCELWGRTGCADVITDVRFPNEAAMVRQLGGEIWQIRRTGIEAGATGHASDNDGSQFNPDRIIYNNGSLEELRETVLKEWRK